LIYLLNWNKEAKVSDQIDVHKVARLGALAVSDDEVVAVGQKLNAIVGLFDQLAAINTDGVEPMAHPLDQVQRLREDVVTETDIHEYVQQIAPKVEAGLYLVPKVIE
jgi:aspartyl-tRNA(Asn)/glutamyl-tRNA(Gln) amidotransferase subunit C